MKKKFIGNISHSCKYKASVVDFFDVKCGLSGLQINILQKMTQERSLFVNSKIDM